jgi:hypothetical protein
LRSADRIETTAWSENRLDPIGAKHWTSLIRSRPQMERSAIEEAVITINRWTCFASPAIILTVLPLGRI